MADAPKQTQQTPAPAPAKEQEPEKVVAKDGVDYTTITDSGNSWEDEAKKVREAAAAQKAGNPSSPVNNVDDSDDVGTTSDTHKYTFTDVGVVVEATSLAEAMGKLNEQQKEENK